MLKGMVNNAQKERQIYLEKRNKLPLVAKMQTLLLLTGS